MLHLLTKIDNLARPLVLKLPTYLPVFIYSYGRKLFLEYLNKSIPQKKVELPSNTKRIFWGIEFQSNLFNAAGIFKEVYGYELCYRQGAGAFLAGTITPRKRGGNTKKGIKHPFIPLQKSKAAINWMGLPNVGIDEALARVQKIDKKTGCPIGLSISLQPDSNPNQAIQEIIDTIKKIEQSQVDFIELNESCPNVEHTHSDQRIGNLDKSLVERLEKISKEFIMKRNRKLPIIVKFSNDTELSQVNELIQLLVDLNFDGINFGNTSINYQEIKKQIQKSDIKNFDYFTQNFGGGVSGVVLRNKSLELCKKALSEISKLNNVSEFIVIRTGGIEDSNDLIESNNAGIHLNQWFTGYFEMFSKYGNDCYLEVLKKLLLNFNNIL